MSAGDINFILSIWAASLTFHNDEPPFSNAKHMYDTIDSTPLGDVPWESFTFQYNGTQPAGDIPSWMQTKYDIWFRNPRALIHNLLSNPDFELGFDYAPFQEHTADGVHRFRDFMSANWAWNQAVRCCYGCFLFKLTLVRTLLLRIPKPMALSFAPSFLAAIKLLYPSLQDTMNIGPSISPLVTCAIASDEHIVMALCSLVFLLSLKVSHTI